MYDMLNGLLEGASLLVQGYCLQYFYGSFSEGRMHGRHQSGFWAAALFLALKVGLNLVMPSDYGSLRIVLRLIFTACILFVLSVCFYKMSCAARSFLVAAFLAVSEISFFLAYTVIRMGDSIINFMVWCMEQGILEPADTFLAAVNLVAFLSQVSLHLIFCFLLYFSLKKIVRSFAEKDYAIHRTELLFLLAPGMTGVFLCVLLRLIMVTVEDGVPKLLYNRYPLMIFLIPLILLLSLLSILYSVRLFQDMVRLSRERSSKVILESQVNSLQEHIEEMERLYSGIRSMKHDMKNTISVISGLFSEGRENRVPSYEKEELQEYLLELNHTMDRLEFHFKTGNAVVDTLLNMKYHEIKSEIPTFRMDADRLLFPSGMAIHSYDIGIILGNALDNAIEACRKLKRTKPEEEVFIRVSSFQRERLFFMDVENSFDGKLKWNRQTEFPETDKENQTAHGIGLANIKNMVGKYHGAVDWSVNYHVFTLSIMMKNERREENDMEWCRK